MAYDPKARRRAAPAHPVEAQDPAPVDGLLDGRIEVPEWVHDDVPSVAAAAPVTASDPGIDAGADVEDAQAPEVTAEIAPAPAPEVRAPTPVPAPAEPPVAPVPDTPGSRWLFFAFLAAVLVAIVWQLRRRAHR